MKAKDFFTTLVTRILDLFLKLVSAKTVAAMVVTYVGLDSPGPTSVVMVALMWMAVVGARAYEKAAGIVKPFLGGASASGGGAGGRREEP